MSAGVYFFCSLLFASPFLALVAILLHYQVRRSIWEHRKRKGRKNPGFLSVGCGAGRGVFLVTTFYRPRMEFAIEARLREEVEEDDEGDPETPEKGLDRQLRRIRRGEPVEALELRL